MSFETFVSIWRKTAKLLFFYLDLVYQLSLNRVSVTGCLGIGGVEGAREFLGPSGHISGA